MFSCRHWATWLCQSARFFSASVTNWVCSFILLPLFWLKLPNHKKKKFKWCVTAVSHSTHYVCMFVKQVRTFPELLVRAYLKLKWKERNLSWWQPGRDTFACDYTNVDLLWLHQRYSSNCAPFLHSKIRETNQAVSYREMSRALYPQQ